MPITSRLTRRDFLDRAAGLVAGAAGLSFLELGPRVRAAQAATPQQTNADRAVAAYEAMQSYFYLGDGTGLYRETYPSQGVNKYSYLWPFSRALVGTLDLVGVPASLVGGVSYQGAVDDRLAGLAMYWDGAASPPAYDSYVAPPLGPGGDKYYDDNAWVGLALVQHYRTAGTAASLAGADKLFAFAVSGWDGNTSDRYPGGLFWVQQGKGRGLTNHDRTTTANAPNAELGFHLHQLTGSPSYDGSTTAIGAKNMYDWVKSALYAADGTGPSPASAVPVDDDGIGRWLRNQGFGSVASVASGARYFDKVRGDGSIDPTLWSYNQGTMIGASVLQHRLSGQAASPCLTQAEAIASNALSYQGGVDYFSQPAAFTAIFFRNLLLLYPATSDSTLRANIVQSMQAYADEAWSGYRDAQTNLFYFSEEPARLVDQGAMVQIYALLALDANDYAELT